MKKKILLLALIASSAIGMAKVGLETQLKFGVDFYRSINNLNDFQQYRPVKQGFDLNLDFLPFNLANNRIELGLGVGYVGGLFDIVPETTINNNETRLLYQVPLYAIFKTNLVNISNGDSPLYFGLKGGYDFIGSLAQDVNFNYLGGPTVGALLGTEYKNFVAEIFYNGTFLNLNDKNSDKTEYTKDTWTIYHRFGLQLGIRFGNQENEVKPEIKPVQPIVVPKPVVIEKPVEVIKTVEVPKPVEVVKTVEVVKPVVVEVPKVEVKKPEPPKSVVAPKPKGTIIKDVKGGANTGLELGQFTENNLPDILYLKEDGYLYTPSNNSKLYGSNGDTTAKNVYIEKDGDIVFYNGAPLLLKVFKTNSSDPFKVIKDSKGKKLVIKNKTVRAEKVVFFPNKCEGNVCTINGFVSNGKKPTADEVEQIKYFVNTVNNFADSARLEIIGFTDSQGSEAYNKRLGLVRAQGIANLLRENGLKKTLRIIDVYSDGESNPIATNATAEGRYKNRRVEIIFHDMEK